jgi:hypothetical protein
MRAIMKMEEQHGFDWRLIKRVVVTLLPALGIIVVGIFFIVKKIGFLCLHQKIHRRKPTRIWPYIETCGGVFCLFCFS